MIFIEPYFVSIKNILRENSGSARRPASKFRTSSRVDACCASRCDCGYLQGMEYRGIRYTIRTRIVREQWSVAIHPAGVEMKGRVVIGLRSDAELQARAMIDSLLKSTPRKVLRSSSTPQPT
jgi:hypothetical protein